VIVAALRCSLVALVIFHRWSCSLVVALADRHSLRLIDGEQNVSVRQVIIGL
ncbi:unnamed protein product, partial [Sphenostylis stenocarpa]